MRLHRIWAIARKEILQIIRDARSLYLAFLLPIVLVFLFGYAVTLDIKSIPLVVVDHSKSTHSRELIRRFTNSGYFIAVEQTESEARLQDLIAHGRARVGIIIPSDFADQLHRGTAVMSTIADGSDANTSQSTLAYTSMIVSEFNLDRYREAGADKVLAQPISAEVRYWYNPDLDSQNFLVPGLISLIMTILASLLTSLTVAREWERGTMELLISTPIRRSELAIGKLLPHYFIGMVDLILATYVSIIIFDVPFSGSLLLLVLFCTLFLIAALSIGYFISVAVKSQQVAYQFSFLTSFLPGFLLSGFLFPISSMPKAIQLVSLLVPGRYFISALRGLFLKGADLRLLLPEAGALLAFALFFAALATLKFRKRIE